MRPVPAGGTGDRDAQNRAARTAWRTFLAEQSPRSQSARAIIETQGGVTPTLRALGLRPAPPKSPEGKHYLAVRRALERAATGQHAAPTNEYLQLLKPLGTQQQQARVDRAVQAPASASGRALLRGRTAHMFVAGTIAVSADVRRRATYVEVPTDDPEEVAAFRDDPIGFWDGGFGADVEELHSVWFEWGAGDDGP